VLQDNRSLLKDERVNFLARHRRRNISVDRVRIGRHENHAERNNGLPQHLSALLCGSREWTLTKSGKRMTICERGLCFVRSFVDNALGGERLPS
jgi:hypothetical protein